MPSDIREQMVLGAMRLVARRGMHGTSLADVLSQTGAPRGSVYHHFPGGKDELMSAAVELAGDVLLQSLEQVRGSDALLVVGRFLDVWRTVLARSEFGAGCAVLAATVASEPSELQACARQVFQRWHQRLIELLVLGGMPAAAAPDLAMQMVACVEGAVVLCRAERSTAPLESVAQLLLLRARDLRVV